MDDDGERRPDYFKDGQSCEQCKSKLFYLQDGLKYCRRGHQQYGSQVHAQDEFVPGGSSQTTRKEREAPAKRIRILRGLEGLRHFFRCYQLLLRHQCRSLIDAKGCPQQLEALVKDLWMLRLPLIQDRYMAGRPVEEENTEDENESGTGTKRRLYSSQSETEEEEEEEGRDRTSMTGKNRIYPSAIDSLALCYMAMILLRMPISICDLDRWAKTGEIPFLTPMRLIPEDLKSRLAPEWLNTIIPRFPLRPGRLYSAIQNLTALYYQNFKLRLPPLNHIPILYRYIKELALPFDLLPTTSALLNILSDAPSSTAPNSLSLLSFTLTKGSRDRPPLPEATLISVLTLAVKLFHPFIPSNTVYARSLNDPNVLIVDWDAWSTAHAAQSAREHEILAHPFMPGTEDNVSQEDVLNMTGQEMDAYMDWAANILEEDLRSDVVRRGARPIPKDILNLFPIERKENEAQPGSRGQNMSAEEVEEALEDANDERLKTIQGALKVRLRVSDDKENELAQKQKKVSRVGQDYRVYRSEQDLEGIAKAFYEKAAEIACLDLNTLIGEVYRCEKKVDAMGREKRKREGLDLRRTAYKEERKRKVRLSRRGMAEQLREPIIDEEKGPDDEDRMSIDMAVPVQGDQEVLV